MAKILLINPSKWGRGITPIWVASHSSILKENNHEVKFFDATFYSKWTFNETEYNTNNKQYRPTGYLDQVTFNDNDIIDDFLKLCNEFNNLIRREELLIVILIKGFFYNLFNFFRSI